MQTLQPQDRHQSNSIAFPANMDDDNWDLPKVGSPGWMMSRECSLVGLLSLSREHSREHGCTLGDADFSNPSTNDSSASEPVTDDEYHAWAADEEELGAEYPPAPGSDNCAHAPYEGLPGVPLYDAVEHRFSPQIEEPSLKRKLCDPAQDTFVSDYEQQGKKQRSEEKAPTSAGKRGAHVKERPQMQKSARDGQKHWANKVLELRNEWSQKKMWEKNEHFYDQIRMCNRLHIKSQHECLIRQFQMAFVEGLIRLPDNREFCTDESRSFLGWTGFEVVPRRGVEFRRRIEEMFANPPNDKTLNNSLRRAGMVPERGWSEAWSGVGAFVFDARKRASYSGAKE